MSNVYRKKEKQKQLSRWPWPTPLTPQKIQQQAAEQARRRDNS